MPRAITHYLFSQDCFDKLNNNEIKNIIEKNMDVYIFGSQGPNFFTYYNKIPLFSTKNLSVISNLIHMQNINLFFKNMIYYSTDIHCLKQIFNNSNFEEVTISYLCGFFSHYILDKFIHPYIYSLQLKLKEEYKFKKPLSLHKSIETHIDTILLYKFKNLKPYQCKNYTNFKLNQNELLILCDMYKFLLKNVFNKCVSSKDISKCINMFKRTENLLNSSSKIYAQPYLSIKNIICENSQIESMIYLNYKYCINDLLNTSNSLWEDPFTKTTSNKSLLDLYSESIDFYLDLIKSFDLYIKNKATMDDILLKINNNSFFTNQHYKLSYNYKLK
ncbi:zinc dependent phospholipase C family protein [Romboutsia maritimum]|nr:zinc dependent phospholipase C family protein [Romboutsia maritimum]